MSSRRLLGLTPHDFTHGEVMESMGNSRKFRNPFRVNHWTKSCGSYPNPQNERSEKYARIFGTQDEGFSRKGWPF